MKKSFFLQILIFSAVIVFLFSCAKCEAGESLFRSLLTGETNSSLTVSLSSMDFLKLSQYGEERTKNLNRLLRHFSLDISVDGPVSETSLLIDNEQVFSVTEIQTEGRKQTVYSFAPDTVIENDNEKDKENNSSFLLFLENHFFTINKLLDDMYPVFEKTADCFPDLCKAEKISLNFKEYGKAVKRITIRFPQDYVKEHLTEQISNLTDSESAVKFLHQLIYSGPQKIVLLYDAENHMIRISYDGIVGLTENALRKVSISWKCLRTDETIKDDLTLKTPSVKGNNKYNMLYQRNMDLSVPEHHTVDWQLELDLKEEELKKKIMYTSQLSCTDQITDGTLTFSEKQNGKEEKVIIIPSIHKESDSEYSGSLEIAKYSGKIVISSMKSRLSIFPGKSFSFNDFNTATVIHMSGEQGKITEEALQSRLNGILVRKLLSLPKEDIVFIVSDIPDENLNSIIQSIY